MRENTVLLSFILPIYNVEAYLEECVESILQQMTDECEIILVDDGSKDTSGQICDRYAEKSDLVKVVHKENGGLSSARNAGLPVARGEYITFVDSDDKIFPGSVSEILAWIKSGGADLCFLKAVKLYPDGRQIDLGEDIDGACLKAQKKEDAIAHLTSRPKYPGSAWAKIFGRSFLLENDLHFPYDRRYSEDLGFIRDCMLCAQSFDALDVPYYQYRQQRQGSITFKKSTKNFFDLLMFIEESAQKLTVDKKAKNEICESVLRVVAYEYCILLYLYHNIPKEDQTKALGVLRKYKWILRFAGGKKGSVSRLCCQLFGLKFTSFLMTQFRKATVK